LEAHVVIAEAARCRIMGSPLRKPIWRNRSGGALHPAASGLGPS
jgi:hypothetical protein